MAFDASGFSGVAFDAPGFSGVRFAVWRFRWTTGLQTTNLEPSCGSKIRGVECGRPPTPPHDQNGPRKMASGLWCGVTSHTATPTRKTDPGKPRDVKNHGLFVVSVSGFGFGFRIRGVEVERPPQPQHGKTDPGNQGASKAMASGFWFWFPNSWCGVPSHTATPTRKHGPGTPRGVKRHGLFVFPVSGFNFGCPNPWGGVRSHTVTPPRQNGPRETQGRHKPWLICVFSFRLRGV